MGIFDFFSKKGASQEVLTEEISKTRQSFWKRFSKIISGRSTVDQAVLDKLEELLISSDVGVATTLKIITAIEKRVARDKYVSTNELSIILQSEVSKLLHSIPVVTTSLSKTTPHVILVVGVNGVGKTTTIAKIAAQYIQQGKKVILGSADTFRAAALEQLTIWGNRIGATVIGNNKHTDPSSVAYEAIKYGIDNHADIVIIDTAGRLHNKIPLINELSKIKRTIVKFFSDAPHEVLLILDGTTGQNAFLQAQAFTAAVDLTGIVITKLDGTCKGGVILGIVDQFAIPIKYVGIGEKVEDLRLFDAHQFITALFENWEK